MAITQGFIVLPVTPIISAPLAVSIPELLSLEFQLLCTLELLPHLLFSFFSQLSPCYGVEENQYLWLPSLLQRHHSFLLVSSRHRRGRIVNKQTQSTCSGFHSGGGADRQMVSKTTKGSVYHDTECCVPSRRTNQGRGRGEKVCGMELEFQIERPGGFLRKELKK